MNSNDNQKRETLANSRARLMKLSEQCQELITGALQNRDTDTEQTKAERYSDIMAVRGQLIQVATQCLNLATELNDHKTVATMSQFIENLPLPDHDQGYDIASPEQQTAQAVHGITEKHKSLQEALLRAIMPEIDRQLMKTYPDKDRDNYVLVQIDIDPPTPHHDEQLGSGAVVGVAINKLRDAEHGELEELLTSAEAPKQLGEEYAPDIIALLTWGMAQALDDDGEPTGEKHHTRNLMICHPRGMESFTRVDDGKNWETPIVNQLAGGDKNEFEEQLEELAQGKYGKFPRNFARFYLRTAVAGGKIKDE